MQMSALIFALVTVVSHCSADLDDGLRANNTDIVGCCDINPDIPFAQQYQEVCKGFVSERECVKLADDSGVKYCGFKLHAEGHDCSVDSPPKPRRLLSRSRRRRRRKRASAHLEMGDNLPAVDIEADLAEERDKILENDVVKDALRRQEFEKLADKIETIKTLMTRIKAEAQRNAQCMESLTQCQGDKNKMYVERRELRARIDELERRIAEHEQQWHKKQRECDDEKEKMREELVEAKQKIATQEGHIEGLGEELKDEKSAHKVTEYKLKREKADTAEQLKVQQAEHERFAKQCEKDQEDMVRESGEKDKEISRLKINERAAEEAVEQANAKMEQLNEHHDAEEKILLTQIANLEAAAAQPSLPKAPIKHVAVPMAAGRKPKSKTPDPYGRKCNFDTQCRRTRYPDCWPPVKGRYPDLAADEPVRTGISFGVCTKVVWQ